MENIEGFKNLFECILELENTTECCDFFEDICTDRELKGICQRLEVARLLKRKLTYDEIQGELDVSTSTISRINKILQSGNGGFELALERLSEKKRLNRV